MNKTTLVLLTTVAALLATGCKTKGYDLPPGGTSVTDPSGALQITATRVKATKKGFTVLFDLENLSDAGLLIPLGEIEGAWGDEQAAVTIDKRHLAARAPIVGVHLAGSIDGGLFEGTYWVTGSPGQSGTGDAVYLKPKSRLQAFEIYCAVPVQAGREILVRWPSVLAGDAQGQASGPVATNVTWSMAPTIES